MKFKIGDQVKIISAFGLGRGEPIIGHWGTIRTKKGSLWGVEFPGCDTFHNLDGLLKHTNGWYCVSDRLELVASASEVDKETVMEESEIEAMLVEVAEALEPVEPITFWVFHEELDHPVTYQPCAGCGNCDCPNLAYHETMDGCLGMHEDVWVEWFSGEVRCEGCYDSLY